LNCRFDFKYLVDGGHQDTAAAPECARHTVTRFAGCPAACQDRNMPANAPSSLNLILAAGLALLCFVSLAIGTVAIPPSAVFAALIGQGDATDRIIVQELRLPRTLLAAVIGATLALCGAALQGLMRNPLAAPTVFGAPTAAAFGAVLAIAVGWADTLSWSLPTAAIIAAFGSVAALLLLAGPTSSMLTLLLAGLALSSLAGAGVSLVLNLAPNPFAALEIAFWLLGSLEDRSFRHLMIIAPFIAACWAILLATRHQLLVLSLGEDVARTSGVALGRLRWLTLLGVAAGVGASVAVAGVIGFVGLITPHLVRPLVGHDPGRVHLPAMLAGACLLVAADCLARLIPATGEIRLGVLTAIIGVPFFIWLVMRRRRDDLYQGA
jgi:iron complex transport system permease protein